MGYRACFRAFWVFLALLLAPGLPARGASTSTPLAAVEFYQQAVGSDIAVTGEIILRHPAPARGAVVRLTCADPLVAAVPVSVTVPEGQITATFPVTIRVEEAARQVKAGFYLAARISAFYAGATLETSLVLGRRPTPMVAVGFALPQFGASPALAGGGSTTGWIAIRYPAPPEGAVVRLTSEDPTLAVVPTTVTIPEGETSTTFPMVTDAAGVIAALDRERTSSVRAWITALYAGATARSALQLGPPVTMSVPLATQDNTTQTGILYAAMPVPADGLRVALTSDSPAVTVPESLQIPAGATSATFPITIGTISGSQQVTLAAIVAGVTCRFRIMVWHDLLESFAFTPDPVLGGTPATVLIMLDSPAPADGLSMHISDELGLVGNRWEAVAVPAGATTLRVPVKTQPVANPTPVEVYASFGPIRRKTTLTLLPARLTSVTVGPQTVPGGTTATGTVWLTSPAGCDVPWITRPGIAIRLSSDNPAAQVPESFTIPAGMAAATFPVTTTPVAHSTDVHITASRDGVMVETVFTVQPETSAELTLDPTWIGAGQFSQGRITLSRPAPAGGTAVGLFSSDEAVVRVPAGVIVPEGETSATFQAAALPVAEVTSALITASVNGASRSVTANVVPRLAGVGVEQWDLVGGLTMLGTVSLWDPAPAGGLEVALSSDHAAVTVPPSVTVPAGETSVSFPIRTAAVSDMTEVHLSAGCDGTVKGAGAALWPDLLAECDITFDRERETGGITFAGTIGLSRAFPRSFAVRLSSDHPAAQPPDGVLVSAGETKASFWVPTSPVETDTVVWITVSFAGTQRTFPLNLMRPRLTLTFSPDPSAAGEAVTGTVTLSEPAPPGGMLVKLSSSPASLGVPENVTVPEGATTATFPVSTPRWPAGTARYMVVARAQGLTHSALLTVRGGVTLSLSPQEVEAGYPVTATVTLSTPAPPGGLSLNVSVDDPVQSEFRHPGRVSVPPNISVPEGRATAVFQIDTVPSMSAYSGMLSPLPDVVEPQYQPRSVTIRVSDTVWEGVTTATASLRVVPTALESVRIRPAGMLSGETGTGVVTLRRPAPASGATVSLASDKSALPLPATVTVPEGATSVTFPVRAGEVSRSTVVYVTAAYGPANHLTVLSVSPRDYLALAVDPGSSRGGQRVTGTITFGEPALWGTVLRISSSNSKAAAVPETLEMPYRERSATFPITTFAVADVTRVEITVSYGWLERKATLWVLPANLIGITLDPSRAAAGGSVTGTVTLSSPAPPGGAFLTLSSSNPAAASVPSSVTVEAGALTATFPVSTHDIAGPDTVFITASYPTGAGGGVVQLSSRDDARTAALSLLPVRGIGVFRPATREWILRGAEGQRQVVAFGGPDDVGVPADYVGAGEPQIAVFRLPTRAWFIRTGDGRFLHTRFGGPDDAPVPADYFGLRRAAIAVFRTTTQEWFLRRDDGSAASARFGGPGDRPVPADYFGLKRVQIAVYRPRTGEWFLRRDDGSAARAQWGGPGDVPVPADYFGLERSQIAVFRPGTAEWFLRDDAGRPTVIVFGGPGDVPVPGDYLGLGHAQIAVFRPGTADWFIRLDDGGSVRVPWGGPKDQPISVGLRAR